MISPTYSYSLFYEDGSIAQSGDGEFKTGLATLKSDANGVVYDVEGTPRFATDSILVGEKGNTYEIYTLDIYGEYVKQYDIPGGELFQFPDGLAVNYGFAINQQENIPTYSYSLFYEDGSIVPSGDGEFKTGLATLKSDANGVVYDVEGTPRFAADSILVGEKGNTYEIYTLDVYGEYVKQYDIPGGELFQFPDDLVVNYGFAINQQENFTSKTNIDIEISDTLSFSGSDSFEDDLDDDLDLDDSDVFNSSPFAPAFFETYDD